MKKKKNVIPLKPPRPAGRDRTFGDLGDELARISVDLADALKFDRLTSGEKEHAARAFGLVNGAAIELLKLEEELNKLRVSSLGDRCRCGWDRGGHGVLPPYACEEDPRCPGFELATLDTMPASPAGTAS
jgi:hypothetical protein